MKVARSVLILAPVLGLPSVEGFMPTSLPRRLTFFSRDDGTCILASVKASVEASVEADRGVWHAVFKLIDTDKSGYIDREELKSCLVALDQPSEQDDITRLLESTGIEESNAESIEVDEETFIRIVQQNQDSEEEGLLAIDHTKITEIFHAIDIDASGYITTAELQHFLGGLRINLSDCHMSDLFSIFDKDGNGRITIDEFKEEVAELGFKLTGCDKEYEMNNVDGSNKQAVDTTCMDHSSSCSEQEEGDMEEEQQPSKLIALDTISNEDLRNALSKFDTDGSGTINIKSVHEAAERKLHWSEKRKSVGLSDHIVSVNHIAIIVSDISRSTQFYTEIMGFEQIRRPNFDAHGAWLTMGNIELHLIKGKPIAPTGDDLIVGHISLDAINIDGLAAKLRSLGVPFRQNVSVPKGADAGSMGTNSDSKSDQIVNQYFLQDPDGYYLEVCNCEVLTDYCLGDKPRSNLVGYEEGIKSWSLSTCATAISVMQQWVDRLDSRKQDLDTLSEQLKETDGSISQVASLLGCERATEINESLLSNLLFRRSVYGDICQNEEEADMREIVLESGNNADTAYKLMLLRQKFRGASIYRPPAFFEDGEMVTPDAIEFSSSSTD